MPNTFKESTFNGKPTCSVMTGINNKTGEEWWFSFGLTKAKAILEHVREIQEWVRKQEAGN